MSNFGLGPCSSTRPHTPQSNTVRMFAREDRVALCMGCEQEIASFWIDGDDDQIGRWSPWKIATHVITEEPEWSELVSSSICSITTSPETNSDIKQRVSSNAAT